MVKDSSFIRSIHKNEGFTLIEALVAITIVALVSVGMTSLIFSISRTSRMSEEQLKVNAMMSVVKENVIYSARSNADIPGNPGINARACVSQTGLAVVDLFGHTFSNYTFDIAYQSAASYGDSSKTVKVFKTVIKRSSDTVADFFIEVYY